MRDYRDLQVWRKAHQLTLAVYRASGSFPAEERYGLTSQMRRSVASIAANLAEGCGRRADREMARFVQIAMGSGAELSYHLLLAHDLALVRHDQYQELDASLGEIMRMLSGLSQKLRSNGSGNGVSS